MSRCPDEAYDLMRERADDVSLLDHELDRHALQYRRDSEERDRRNAALLAGKAWRRCRDCGVGFDLPKWLAEKSPSSKWTNLCGGCIQNEC